MAAIRVCAALGERDGRVLCIVGWRRLRPGDRVVPLRGVPIAPGVLNAVAELLGELLHSSTSDSLPSTASSSFSSSGSPCRIGATIHGKCSLLARPGPTIPPFPPRLVAERRSRLGPSVADHGPRTRGTAQAHRLASRLRGSAPVEARGIAALKDLLTDRGGPVYTPGDPNTLERKLELIDQWLDVQSEQARSPSSREAYAKCTEVLSRRG